MIPCCEKGREEEEEEEEEEEKEAEAPAAAATKEEREVEPEEAQQQTQQQPSSVHRPSSVLSASAARERLHSDKKVPLVRSLLRATMPLADELESAARTLLKQPGSFDAATAATDAHDELVTAAQRLGSYLSAFEKRADDDEDGSGGEVAQGRFLTCRRFRRATRLLLASADEHEEQIDRSADHQASMRAASSLIQLILFCALLVLPLSAP